MESSSRTFLSLVAFVLMMISSASALEFYVGNDEGWVANPSQKYNEWAGKLRFLINDVLVFKYSKEESILLVHRDDYDTCNSKNPIMTLTGGYSDFKFDRSGPFFFVSSKPENCAKGQKMIVVVLADRKSSPPPSPPSPQIPASPTPSTKPPTSSPSPPPHSSSTKPPISSPSPSPSPSTKPPTSSHQLPTSSPSPSPSTSTKPPTLSPSPLTTPSSKPPPPPGSQVPPYDIPRCPPVIDDGHHPPSAPPMDQAPPSITTALSPFPLTSNPTTPSPPRSPIAAPAPSPSSASFTTVSYLSLAMLLTMFFV